MSVITLEEMQAAAGVILKDKMTEEQIAVIARRAMNHFGFDDSVIDNSLNPKDRDVFYLLEEIGLITTLEDETYLERGKKWRIHYWVLNKEKIKRLAYKEEEEEDIPASVYAEWKDEWHESDDIDKD